jgi:hypothetical protein
LVYYLAPIFLPNQQTTLARKCKTHLIARTTAA